MATPRPAATSRFARIGVTVAALLGLVGVYEVTSTPEDEGGGVKFNDATLDSLALARIEQAKAGVTAPRASHPSVSPASAAEPGPPALAAQSSTQQPATTQTAVAAAEPAQPPQVVFDANLDAVLYSAAQQAGATSNKCIVRSEDYKILAEGDCRNFPETAKRVIAKNLAGSSNGTKAFPLDVNFRDSQTPDIPQYGGLGGETPASLLVVCERKDRFVVKCGVNGALNNG